MEAPKQNEEHNELESELQSLGFDVTELNGKDFEVYSKHKNGELTEGELIAHKNLLGDNFSPTPNQLKLLEYLSENL